MPQWKAPVSVNQGDRQTYIDPVTLKPVGSFAMNETPDGRAGRAVTMRGQNMADARAGQRMAFDQGQATAESGGPAQAALIKQFGKPPASHRWKPDGSMERISGSPAEQEALVNAGKLDASKANRVASFDVMLDSLGRLGDHPGLSRSVGLIGAFPTIPGTNSANFIAELDTFKSQAFLPMVENLKGMGALSNAEGLKLTQAVGALDIRMGEKAVRSSIDRIKKDMTAARGRLASSSTGSLGPETAAPPASGQDAQALQWARSNPGDPRAEAIMQKLGVK
jgi:hypothetical protein